MRVTRKFSLALVAGIVAVHTLAAGYRIHRERDLFERDTARDARVLGRALGHAVQRTWETHGEAAALAAIEHATNQESHIDIRWVWVDPPDADLEAEVPVVPAEARASMLASQPIAVWMEGDAGGTILTYVPVSIDGVGLGAIEVADALADERQYVISSVLNVLVATLVLIALCAALTWFLGTRLIGRPLRRVVEQARAIGRSELHHRLRLPVRDEVGELAAEMDAMCDRLEEARDRLEEETQSRIDAVDQLRHADRLRTVGTLASGIAHELGTPINVIAGHASLLREAHDDDPQVTQTAELIGAQCKRMATIIRQLLDFGRRGEAAGGSCDAMEVAERTVNMVSPLARQQNVEITVRGASPAPVGIAFEPLQQVLANLLVNGLHAMPDGGVLDVRVALPGRRDSATGKQFCELSVRDVGIGMDAATQERIFEPFFTTKDVGAGTGLGLSVAYGIIEDHGGWIETRSTPGRGSTFTVSLPIGGDA